MLTAEIPATTENLNFFWRLKVLKCVCHYKRRQKREETIAEDAEDSKISLFIWHESDVCFPSQTLWVTIVTIGVSEICTGNDFCRWYRKKRSSRLDSMKSLRMYVFCKRSLCRHYFGDGLVTLSCPVRTCWHKRLLLLKPLRSHWNIVHKRPPSSPVFDHFFQLVPTHPSLFYLSLSWLHKHKHKHNPGSISNQRAFYAYANNVLTAHNSVISFLSLSLPRWN